MIKICIECGKSFYVKPYLVRKGYGKFCSSKCYGKWQSKNRKGKDNPSWKGKIQVKCSYCDKIIEIYPYEYEKYEHHFCNINCRSKWQKESGYMQGDKNPLWVGGHTQYRGSNWEGQRERALIRDNFICQKCGKEEDLVVHHKKPYHLFENYRDANKLTNLITLRTTCHGIEEIEFNRNNKDLVGDRKIPNLKPDPKICEKCGKMFIPRSPKTRWCDLCRIYTCLQCGKIFFSSKYRDVKFCSKKCNQQFRKDHAIWPRKCKICGKKIASGRIYCKHCFLTQIKPASKSRLKT